MLGWRAGFMGFCSCFSWFEAGLGPVWFGGRVVLKGVLVVVQDRMLGATARRIHQGLGKLRRECKHIQSIILACR